MGSEGRGLFGGSMRCCFWRRCCVKRELEKAAQRFKQRDEQTNDCGAAAEAA